MATNWLDARGRYVLCPPPLSPATSQHTLPGEFLEARYEGWGVSIAVSDFQGDHKHHHKKHKNNDFPGRLIAFDSAAPVASGGDDDLLFPNQNFYNIMIIAEDIDGGEDGIVDDPDDSKAGGLITFTFVLPTKVMSVDLLDIEEGSDLTMRDVNGNALLNLEVPATGDNEAVNVASPIDGYFGSFDIRLPGSGAVDNVQICVLNP